MSGNHKISIDSDLLSDIKARFNWADPEFRDAVEHTLSEFVEHTEARGEELGDLAAPLTLAALRGDGSVAMMLGSPPMDERWKNEYGAQVSKRLVGLLAIRLYTDHTDHTHVRWSTSDDEFIRTFSDILGPQLASSGPPPTSWKKLCQFVRDMDPKDMLASYVERSAIHTGSSTFDTTVSRPTSTTSDEALLREQLLNGLWPATPDDRATITQDWRHHDPGEHGYSTPSVRVTLGDDATPLVKIEFAFEGNEGEFGESSTPTDARWEFAKHCVRVSNLLEGQLRGHLGRGHVLTGTYRAAFDQVAAGHNPAWALLRPFLVLVDAINELGEPLIYGRGGIIASASGLSEKGVAAVLGEVLNHETWNRWTPPHSAHPRRQGAYGEAASAFAEVLERFVGEYFGAHEAEILSHWQEVDEFCAALNVARTAWKPANDVANVTSLAEFRRLVEHAIFHASFFHTWANNQQWQTGADPSRVSFGLREPPGDADYQEWLREATPSYREAWLQMLLADVLSHTSYGCWSDLKAHRGDYQELLSNGDHEIIETLMVALANHATARDHLSLDNFRPFVAI